MIGYAPETQNAPEGAFIGRTCIAICPSVIHYAVFVALTAQLLLTYGSTMEIAKIPA
jgi:hypothetical protein